MSADRAEKLSSVVSASCDALTNHVLNVFPWIPSVSGDPQGLSTACLEGAIILRAGIPETTRRLEGGGFVIDYVPKDEITAWRMVLEFTEMGIWLASNSPLASTSQVG